MWGGEAVWLCLVRCVRVTGANLPGQGVPTCFLEYAKTFTFVK
jgi:hypothetical protein